MEVTRRDYSEEQVSAARMVLLEVSQLLQQYQDDIVLVGGWVPDLLLPDASEPHVGSIDVDLAVNHLSLDDVGYRTIEQLLLSQDYKRGDRHTNPASFFKSVDVGGRFITVNVDFVAGEYGGRGKKRRHQKVQKSILAHKARGCDLVFQMCTEVVLDGRLPNGGLDRTTIRIACIVPFLVMKGMALCRGKAKDAYDICYCLGNYPGGVEAIVEEFRPHLHHSLVREGLTRIGEKFASVEHVGPKQIAAFESITDPEERAIVERDAFERVNYLLGKLGVL